MSETKHEGFTPGPWRYDKRGEILIGANGQHVVVWGSGISFGSRSNETESNAALIADAPRLYAENVKMRALLAEMRDELSPGATGGNDYHDAWEVFGKKIEAIFAEEERDANEFNPY